MSKAILIIGLPGSGKTYLAQTKYVPIGYTLIDDPSNDKKSRNLMVDCITNGENIVITDPHLCNETTRKIAINNLENNCYDVECVYFENDEAKCKRLIALRNDGRNIKTFQAFNYTIPDDVKPLKIYERD